MTDATGAEPGAASGLAEDAAPTRPGPPPRRHFARRRINPFVAIVLTIMTIAYTYIGCQLILPLELGSGAAFAVWLCLLAPFGMILWLPFVYWQLEEPTPAQDRLLWAAFGSMALLSFLLFYVALRDLLLLGAGLLGFLAGLVHGPGPIGARAGAAAGWVGATSRVPLALLDGRGTGAILALTAVSLALGYRGARRTPAVTEVEVPLDGLPEALQGLRIVQISDLHIGATIRGPFVARVVEQVNALKPDLVALTGDIADGSVKQMAPHFELLSRLEAPLGRFYVTGNHEYYWEHEAWLAEARKIGLIALTNTHAVVERGGASSSSPACSTTGPRATAEPCPRIRRRRSRARPATRPRASCSRTSPRPRWPRADSATSCSSRGTRTADSSCRDGRRQRRAALRSRALPSGPDVALRQPWYRLLGSADAAGLAVGDHVAQARAGLSWPSATGRAILRTCKTRRFP